MAGQNPEGDTGGGYRGWIQGVDITGVETGGSGHPHPEFLSINHNVMSYTPLKQIS